MLYRQRFARRVSFSFYLAVHQEKPKQIRASLYIYISLFVGAAVAMIESAIPGIMRLYCLMDVHILHHMPNFVLAPYFSLHLP